MGITPNIFKLKTKQGVVDRLYESDILIGKNMFKKETDLSLFTGLKIHLDTQETGKIIAPFGKSGKIKVEMDDDLEIETIMRLDVTGDDKQLLKVELNFWKKM